MANLLIPLWGSERFCGMKKKKKEVKMEQNGAEKEITVENSTEQTESNSMESTDTPEEVSEAKADEKDEVAEMKDKYLRLYSEFENYRRRTAKEKLDLIGSASAELLTELLPVMDDFDRAAASANDEKADFKQLKEGFNLIRQKFNRVLTSKGLKEMECGQGADFDVELHEAITQIPAPTDKLKGKIVDVVEKGYTLNEKVIRFAKVVVGS